MTRRSAGPVEQGPSFRAFTLSAVCLVLAGIASALPGPGVMIPSGGFVKGWKKDGPVRRFVPSDLTWHINGGAELVLEFGFEELFVQHYSLGDTDLSLELYRMQSPEASLGLYLSRGGVLPDSGSGASGKDASDPEWITRNPSQWLARRGPYFLTVENPGGDRALEPVMEALMRESLSRLPSGEPAAIPGDLGRREWIPGSVRLFRGPVALEAAYTFGTGDVFGLSGGFGVYGGWRCPDGSVVTRFHISYPGEAGVAAALEALQARLDPSLRLIDANDGGFVFSDYAGEYGDVRRAGQSLIVRVHLKEKPAPMRKPDHPKTEKEDP
ncbi:hypothetical protein JW777_03115 [bacterium]|nr:hypothetical protein [bacterium]